VNAIAIGYEPEASGASEVLVSPFSGAPIAEVADPLIVLLDACADVNDLVLGYRKLEINEAVKQGARLVLTIGPGYGGGQNSKFVSWLMTKFGFATSQMSALEIRSEVPQLRGYFSQQFCHATVGDNQGLGDIPRNGQVLATAINADGQSVGTAASRWMHEESEIVVLPHWTPSAHGALEAVVGVLLELPSRADYPDYLDDFPLGDEPSLRDESASIRERAAEIEGELEAHRRSKGILYLTGIDLEREVARFLTELGIPSRHVPGNREDLQLVDEAGDVWGIGEVKAAERRTVERTEIGKVDIHRSEAGHPSEFPALLVASTFRALQSVEERDKEIPPNIRRRAADDHVLIVRALDLIRLKQMEFAGTAPEIGLQDAMRRGGGWYEVRPNFSIKIHTK